MRTLHKYTLKYVEIQEIVMPYGAEILTVQVQKNLPRLWALVEPEQLGKQRRRFRIAGTGRRMETAGRYIGTFQLHDGDLVLHVFEEICAEGDN